jgi:hypothetical protein
VTLRRATTAAVVVVLALGLLAAWGRRAADDVVRVRPGTAVTTVAAAHPGATLVLEPGRHLPFELRGPATVRAEPGAVVAGGSTGVLVRGTDGVVLEDLVVIGPDLHGIEVVDASATVAGCRVEGLRSPYAQGIEVRNANGRPRTRIRGCAVHGGQEGIVSHVSRVEVVGNEVRGTTMRGIAVTEMSEGLIEGNRVRDVAGAALLCGDMSHCEVVGNDVRGVADQGRGSRSHSGHGVSVLFSSTARLRGNSLEATAAAPVGLYTGSVTTDRFPLSVWPAGWRGALPAVPVALLALGGLTLLRGLAGAVLRRRGGGAARRPVPVGSGLAAVVLGGFIVQSFHMVEHLIQVWQVHVAQGPQRSGLAGARLDVEWVHLGFNLVVAAFLVQVWSLGRRQGWLVGHRGAAPWVLAAVGLQGLHVVEHTAKVVQHVSRGIDPAPGVVGRVVDLVWLHFAVNSAVWAGTAVGVAALVDAVRRVHHRRAAPAPALAGT